MQKPPLAPRLLAMFFPGREWIAACYSVERPSLVALYTAPHPLRVLWLAALGLRRPVGAR